MWRSCRLSFAALAVAVAAAGCAGRNRPVNTPTPPPAPQTQQPSSSRFTATAYCHGTRTASGTAPSESTAAADPAVLPLGSRIKLSGLHEPYNRVYIVEDTGPKVRGRRIDLYIRDCREAVRFGRRSASVSILK